MYLNADICGGYVCFVVSIFSIGVVTAVIGDVASHFGCTLGIRDAVTAIVFVALGTSIPGKDTKFYFMHNRQVCVGSLMDSPTNLIQLHSLEGNTIFSRMSHFSQKLTYLPLGILTYSFSNTFPASICNLNNDSIIFKLNLDTLS